MKHRILTDGKVFRIQRKSLFWWFYLEGYSGIDEFKTEDAALAEIQYWKKQELKSRKDTWKVIGEIE
jgi:hypothetical protein